MISAIQPFTTPTDFEPAEIWLQRFGLKNATKVETYQKPEWKEVILQYIQAKQGDLTSAPLIFFKPDVKKTLGSMTELRVQGFCPTKLKCSMLASYFPKLQKLTLDRMDDVVVIKESISKRLESLKITSPHAALETLEISNSTLSLTMLQNLMMTFSGIRTFKLTDVRLKSSVTLTALKYASKLETAIFDCDVTDDDMSYFVHSAPHFKKVFHRTTYTSEKTDQLLKKNAEESNLQLLLEKE